MFFLEPIKSIATCRSFIASLSNMAESPEDTYIDLYEKGGWYFYKNCLDKPTCLKTSQIFDAIDRCSFLLKMNEINRLVPNEPKIDEKERRLLLKNLDKGLKGYEHKLNTFFKRHWLRGLFAWGTYRRISQLKTSIKGPIAETLPGNKNHATKRKTCHRLLYQINSLFSTVVKKLKNKKLLVDFLYPKLGQIDAWREESFKLPFKETQKVFNNIFALEKKLHLEAKEQWFCIQQKKDIEATKQLLDRVKIELNEIRDLAFQELHSKSGFVLFPTLFFIRLTITLSVSPLKRNRFFKLSPTDDKSAEAVDVSCEIYECIKFSEQLGESLCRRISHKMNS